MSAAMSADRPYTVFDAVAAHDLEGIITEYIKNSQNTIVSYLSLRKRWRSEVKQGAFVARSMFSTSYGKYVFLDLLTGTM